MTADIATLGIRIDARQVRDADVALDRLAQTGQRTERSVDATSAAMARLQRMAAAVGAALSAAEIIKQADAWANLQGRLSLVADTTERLTATNEALFSMAQRTRQGLVATADLYGKISRSTEDLNKTDAERLRLTETINKTLVISGASAESAAGALLQLGQAFGKNKLAGEELNSVLEGAPRLAQAIANGVGKTVGELKQLAEAGKLTSEVLFSALGNQAAKIDAEFDKLPTTVGQAVTQMQNALLRTIGVFDQQNQLSAGLASALGGVANHMDTVATAAASLTAVKLVNWLQDGVVAIYGKIAATTAQIAADREAAASALATAAASRAQAAAAVTVAEAEASAALGANARVAANERLTAATVALAAAERAQAAAATGAANVAGWGARALGLLGGPLGLITLALGVGATAWSLYGNKAEEAAQKTEKSLAENHADIISKLDKEIEKFKERNRLMGVAPTIAKSDAVGADDQRAILSEINRVSKDANLTDMQRTEILRVLGQQYNDTTVRMAEFARQQNQYNATTSADKMKSWLQKHTEYLDKAGKIRAAVAEAEKEFGDSWSANKDAVTKMITASFNKSDVDKAKSAYQELIAAVKEKIAANQIEIKAGRDATEAQKEQIKFDEQLASGKLKLSTVQRKAVQAALDQLAVTEKQARAVQVQKDLNKAADEAALAQREAAAGLTVAVAGYGKLSDARDIDMVAVKNQFELERKLMDAQYQHLDLSDAQIAKLRADTDERTKNEQAILAQTKALQYAEQLRQANQQFKIDYTIDPKAKAAAQLAIDKALWQSRISLAAEGTEARKLLETEYATWLQNQSIKPALDAQIAMWDSIEQAARDAFVGMFTSGKSTFERLRDSLKNTLYAFLYEMTLKKWIVQVEAQMIGTTMSGSAGAGGQSGVAGLIGKVQQAKSLYNTVSGGLMDSAGGLVASAGNALSTVGSWLGMSGSAGSSMSAFGAGLAGNSAGTTMTASEMFASAGMTGEASAASYGAMAGGAATVLGGVAGGIFGGRAISGGYGGNGAVNTGTAIGAAVGSIIPVIGTALGALVGGLLGGVYNRMFGRKAPEIESQGLRGTYTSGSGVSDGETYQNIIEKGGWFKSDKKYQETQGLTDAMQSQITQAFTTIEDTGSRMAKTLGVGNDALKNYSKTFDITLTKDAAANEKALTDFFAGVADDVARQLVPNLDQFSQSGETAAATLERLVSEFDVTTAALQNVGLTAEQAFGTAGIASAAMRERLVQLAGGASALTSLTSSYASNFLTEAERLAPVSKALDAALGSLGLSTIPATRDEFKSLVSGLDLTTEAGEKQFVALMQLAEAFATVHQSADAAAQAVKDAYEAQLDAGYSALERAVDAQKSIVETAFNATMKQIGKAIDRTKDSVSGLTSLSKSLHDAVGKAGVDETSRQDGQAQIRAALAIAKAGGPLPTADALKNALEAVTKDSKDAFSSFEDYQRDRLQTAIDLADLSNATDDQLSTAEKQLAVLEATKGATQAAYDAEVARLDGILETAQRQIDAIKGVDISVQTVTGALASLQALMAGNTAAGIVGAYGNALGRAPDAAGLAYWQGQAAAGVSMGDITKAIGSSAEAASKIETLYETVLGRQADAAGLAYWEKALGSGLSLGDIEAQIRASDEAKNNLRATSTTSSGTSTTIAATPALNDAEIKLALQKIASYTQRAAVGIEDQNRETMETA